jgi:hypothetical protein
LPLNDSITESPKIIEIHSDWHTPFMVYLRTGDLQEDKVECERLHQWAGQYTLANDEPYRRGANDTLMKCVTLEEECVILQDIHVGVCRSHAGAKSLVGKMYRQGFFWPTTVFDADSIVRRCEGCQFFASQKYVPSHQLQIIPIT